MPCQHQHSQLRLSAMQAHSNTCWPQVGPEMIAEGVRSDGLTFDLCHVLLQLLPCCLKLLLLPQQPTANLLQLFIQLQVLTTLTKPRLHLTVGRRQQVWSRGTTAKAVRNSRTQKQHNSLTQLAIRGVCGATGSELQQSDTITFIIR